MSVCSPRRLGLIALIACALALAAVHVPLRAAPAGHRDGTGLIWVPTPERAVVRMLELAGTGPGDRVVDLGSGDGRIPIAAARLYGASGLGVELDPALVERARERAERAGVADRVRFVRGDLFEADLAGATVVALYLLPELNLKLRARLLALAPGTRIVSHAFDMGDWPPDARASADGAVVRLWIVPARVAGTWTWDLPGPAGSVRAELSLSQQYQRVQGVLDLDGRRMRVRDAALRGDELRFAAVEPAPGGDGPRREFIARVRGDAMEGRATTAGTGAVAWRAVRLPPATRAQAPAS